MTFQTAALVIGGLTSLISLIFAQKHLTAEGESSKDASFYWRPRAHFTETGWRYRAISLTSGWAVFVLIAVGYFYKVLP